MSCFHPLRAYVTTGKTENGKRNFTFNAAKAISRENYEDLPCGQCIGCRLDKTRQWGIRMLLEASEHEQTCFVTLTYDDDHLPYHGDIVKSHIQKYVRALRDKYPEKKIRFYQCAEYGEITGRPHFHIILFGFDFPDKEIAGHTRTGEKIYKSQICEDLWLNRGGCRIGDVNQQTASYVAGYVTKKVTGKNAEEHYERIDPDTGEIYQLTPPCSTMSRRPGIGANWFKKYKTDVYPSDNVIVNGFPQKPPKFFDGQYEIINPEGMQNLKDKRKRAANKKKVKENNTSERLAVREKVKQLNRKSFKRDFQQE